MLQIYYQTVNIHGIYASLEEVFEFAGAPLQKDTKLYHNQVYRRNKIERIYFWNPMTIRLISYVNIDLRHQY